MNCDWVKANITLYVYDELADDSRFELEQHVSRCADCAAELKSVGEFRSTMSALPQLEPSPNLLTAARMRLQESLETTEQHRGLRLLDPMMWLRQLRFQPALAAVLLILGFAGGVGATWQVARNSGGGQSGGSPVTNPAVLPQEASIAGIRQITQEPGTNKVAITYDTTVPQKVEGSLNDQRIQQLLLFAARNNGNSGLREDAVNQLSQKPEDQRIRESLKASLLFDSNPGVRLKALEALSPYVQSDVTVRDAILEALQNDSNPGVRAEALHYLQPVRVDGSVRMVLQRLSREDKSDYIRRQSSRILASLPEID